MTRQHRAIEIELPEHLSMFGAVTAVVRAVRDTTLVRGGLTAPEVNAVADELLAWLADHHARTAAAAAALPPLLMPGRSMTEGELTAWLGQQTDYLPRAGSVVMGVDYGFDDAGQFAVVDEPGQQ